MKTVFTILAIWLSALPLQAQQRSTVSFSDSTLGATPEAGYRLGPNFGGVGRISAGSIAANYGADLLIFGDIVVEGTTFNGVGIVGTIDTINRIAPVFAIGFEKVFGNNWGVSADLGAMDAGGLPLATADNSVHIPRDLLASELADTTADLGQFKILPFVKLSVSFSF